MERNPKTIVDRVWMEIIDEGILDAVDELLAADYEYRGPGGLALHGPDEFRDYIAALRQQFGDVHIDVHEYVTEGHRVVSRWTGRGHHLETDRAITWSGTTISQVTDGKVVDDWEFWDRLGIAEQLASGWIERRLVGAVARRTMRGLPID